VPELSQRIEIPQAIQDRAEALRHEDPPQPRTRTLPPLLARAFGFGRAVVALADDQVEARLAVCRACDQFNPEAGSCAICGCAMATKARWADQACPLGKWPAPG
jgi:hypothetical protein